MKQCCTADSSILKYRVSKNGNWQEIKLANGAYCTELIAKSGGWVLYVNCTPPGSYYNCIPQLFVVPTGDTDPSSVWTLAGGSASTCPGNNGRMDVLKNGNKVSYADDVVSYKYVYEQPTCNLVITDKNNLEIFNLKANLLASNICPIEYSFNCNSNCATGYLECKSNDYPGYCCIPCNEIKGEIKAIASQIRSLTNG